MKNRSSSDPEVAIIGAGPYGLSIAAHLCQRAVPFRIFGVPMGTWKKGMPRGMLLKSEGAASNLSDPNTSWTLARHCAETRVRYGDEGVPVPLDVFVNYGLAFQQRLVPQVEETMVVALSGSARAFHLRLETGEIVRTRNVVLSVGTTYFEHVPNCLAHLPADLTSHSAHHSDLGRFKGRDVIVIGGGQSALETAALIQEQGGKACILVRSPGVAWHGPPSVRSKSERLCRPNTGLGAGWRYWFYCNGPGAFRCLPHHLRFWIVDRALGPAGAWWLKDRVVGHIPVMVGHIVQDAWADRDRVRVRVTGDGQEKELLADHVIAATGYTVDVSALRFIDRALLGAVRRVGTVPVLSRMFESSVQGLYFAGLASAGQFGPAMRFVVGARYTARTIANALRPRPADTRASAMDFLHEHG